MTDDKDMEQSQEYAAGEEEKTDPSLTEEPQQIFWTKEEKRRTIIEMIIVFAIIAVLVRYGVKFVSPFIQNLFRPLTDEDFDWLEEYPEDGDSKTDMYKDGGRYVFEYENAVCRVPAP